MMPDSKATSLPIRYLVKVDVGSTETLLIATFRPVVEDIVNQHPIDLFGAIFRETLQRAALAFEDPNVTEVPVYQEGVLEPVAHLSRKPE